ncbi:MAG: histidine phosphatase family protein [Patescibacteria group bacterium]
MSERTSREFEPSKEQEPSVESTVALRFMRHAEKEKLDIPDDDIPLTVPGRMNAWRKGTRTHAKPEVSVAVGSPKKRTRETSAHVMLGSRVAPHADLEEMEREIARFLKVGKKVMTDERLNLGAVGPVGIETNKSYDENAYFRYLAEKSDLRAEELHDLESGTLKRYAGNVAELIQHYLEISDAFHGVVENDSEKYKKYSNRLERYLGTHVGIQESFIVKVLEKLSEDTRRRVFIEAYPNGFAELQGMNIDISTHGRERTIFLTYEVPDKSGHPKTERIMFGADVLEQIIEERYQFEQAVAEKE